MAQIVKTYVLSSVFTESAASLIKCVWGDKSAAMLRRQIANDHLEPEFTQAFYVATMQADSERMLGFCRSAPSSQSDHLLCLSWLAVDPERQRMGIGRQMIDACVEEAATREEGITGILVGTGAPNFFKACGFQPIATYEPENRHIMLFKF